MYLEKYSNVRINRLTILNEPFIKNNRKVVTCLCECGITKEISLYNIIKERTKSCGCYALEVIQKRKNNSYPSSFNALYYEYKIRSKKRNITFNLTKDEFMILIKSKCHYCGEFPNKKFHRNDYSDITIFNGIDRVDNQLGYVTDNCVACCEKCNFMKGTLPKNSFLEQVNKIYKYQGAD